LGLSRIGFIWTSIKVNENKEVIAERNQECPLYCTELIRMGHLQSRYPNPWNNSDSKQYGSKFVSVLCYGSYKNPGNVDLEAFQMSNQGVALVKDEIIKASKEDHLNFRVKRSNETTFYPDLQYQDVNEYGKNVIKRADPYFPAYFFIIGLRFGFPKNPKPSFPNFNFPVYNMDDKSTWEEVRDYFRGKRGKDFFNSLLNFHLILFLAFEHEENQEILTKISQIYNEETVSESEVTHIIDNIITSKIPKAHIHHPNTTPQPTQPSQDPNNARRQEMVNEILKMGFSKEQAEEAIFATGGTSIENAVNYIFTLF